MKTAVIIVTCNAAERLRKHLGCLSTQTKEPDAIIIVDNGTVDLGWAGREFPKLRIEFLKFDNIGPAGGFKEGAKKAYADGYDLIIFADDDAFPAKDTVVENLAEDAEAGNLVSAGYSTDGMAIGSPNHYYAVKREVFLRTGFYFDPYFLMREDTDFAERLNAVAKVHHDSRVLIDHPWRLTTASYRTYLSARNSMMDAMIKNRIGSFLFLFYHYYYRTLFIALFQSKTGFLMSFVKAFTDLALGRSGRQTLPSEDLELEETEPIPSSEKSVFVALGVAVSPPFGLDRTETIKGGDFLKGLGGDGSVFRFAERLIHIIRFFSGKNIVLANTFMLGYHPFTVFVKRVYWYDVMAKKLYRYYDNNPVMSFVFMWFFAPLALALLPIACLVFFLKKDQYRKLWEHRKADDLEFCRKADDALRQ